MRRALLFTLVALLLPGPASAGLKILGGGGAVTVSGVPWVGNTLTAGGVPSGATCAWIVGGTTESTSCVSYTLTSTSSVTFAVSQGKTVYTAMTFSGSCATSGTVGTAYSGCSYTGPSGGASPYAFSLSGSWPAWASIASSTGVVSGTPTGSGSFPGLSVTATDSVHGSISISSFTLAIAGGSLSITGTPSATGTVGTAYSFVPTVSGGTSPYSCTFTGTLPPGLNASGGSPDTGCSLTGTPTTAGTYAGISESVTDSSSNTAHLAANPFTITVSNGGSSPGTLDLSTPTSVTGLIAVF